MGVNSGVMEKGDEIYVVVRTRSILACILHWVLFCSVITLAVTGYYIAYPDYYFGKGEPYQAFAMANMRLYHFYAASFIIASLVLRFYLAFTPAHNRDIMQFLPTPKNIVNAIKLALFYSTARGEHSVYRFINPLGGIGVFMIVLCLIIQVLTGFMLFLPAESHTSWFVVSSFFANMLGGLQNVRLIHHLVMYILGSILVIHVYMQIWKNVMYTESDISSIIGGYKIFPLKHVTEFADYYGLELAEKPPTKEEMERESTPMPEPPE